MGGRRGTSPESVTRPVVVMSNGDRIGKAKFRSMKWRSRCGA